MTTKKEDIPVDKEIYTFLDTVYKKEEKTLIAVSGGADSIYVSLVMQQYRKYNNRDTNNLHYIYCDHAIRKDNDDQKYIKKYVPIAQLHVVTRTDNKDKKEASLRKRRYEQIKKYMQKNTIMYLITGHHLSDRIESTFLHLLRGCSIDGFMSMQRAENNSHLIDGTIVRPLLTLSKSYIQHICDSHRIQYSYDNTNEDITVSKRNKLRHTILASLKELSHKNTKEQNSFEQSMSEIYTAIESKQEDSHAIDLVKIPMYTHWKIKRAYRWDINQEKITTDSIKKLCKQLHIQNNMDKKYIKELTAFLQHKNKGHKYINHTYFFISNGSIYIIHGPKKFWEIATKNHPENPQDLFDNLIEKKSLKNRRFNKHNDKIHGKSIKKRCTNQKIPIFRRENIVCEIQKDQSLKPIIRDFMKSKKT